MSTYHKKWRVGPHPAISPYPAQHSWTINDTIVSFKKYKWRKPLHRSRPWIYKTYDNRSKRLPFLKKRISDSVTSKTMGRTAKLFLSSSFTLAIWKLNCNYAKLNRLVRFLSIGYRYMWQPIKPNRPLSKRVYPHGISSQRMVRV